MINFYNRVICLLFLFIISDGVFYSRFS